MPVAIAMLAKSTRQRPLREQRATVATAVVCTAAGSAPSSHRGAVLRAATGRGEQMQDAGSSAVQDGSSRAYLKSEIE